MLCGLREHVVDHLPNLLEGLTSERTTGPYNYLETPTIRRLSQRDDHNLKATTTIAERLKSASETTSLVLSTGRGRLGDLWEDSLVWKELHHDESCQIWSTRSRPGFLVLPTRPRTLSRRFYVFDRWPHIVQGHIVSGVIYISFDPVRRHSRTSEKDLYLLSSHARTPPMSVGCVSWWGLRFKKSMQWQMVRSSF